MANLFWPDASQLRDAGYASVAEVPALFSADWKYLKDESRYLRERALLEWHPAMAISSLQRTLGNVRYPTPVSLDNFGRRLVNFVEWRGWRNLQLEDIEYTKHIVQGYQADMLAGRWSRDGSPLEETSVNVYVGEACSYLVWAGQRGIRPPFVVVLNPKTSRRDSARNSHGHRPVEVRARAGAIPITTKVMRLPTPTEVERWLAEVKVKHGETKALVSELIIETAVRIQEAVQWRVDTLPEDPATWDVIGANVQVVVTYGAKGYKVPDGHGELRGPPRNISVPRSFAERLHEYRRTRRLAAWRRFVRAAPDATTMAARRAMQLPRRLFLSEATGLPFSDQALYDSWTSPESCPFKGWSPHKGRHYWACMTLLRSLQRHATERNVTLAMLSGDWVTGQCMSDIDILIRPQLGHVNRQTTERYLTWILKAVTLTNLYTDYAHHLDQADD